MSNQQGGAALCGVILAAVEDCRGISPWAINRAFRLAASELQVPFDVARIAIRRFWLGHGDSLQGHCAIAQPKWGSVYVASVPAVRGFKIGFTQNLDRRRAALQQHIRRPVTIHGTVAGLMLHEHAAHCRNWHRRVVGEWFDFDSAEEALSAVEGA